MESEPRHPESIAFETRQASSFNLFLAFRPSTSSSKRSGMVESKRNRQKWKIFLFEFFRVAYPADILNYSASTFVKRVERPSTLLPFYSPTRQRPIDGKNRLSLSLYISRELVILFASFQRKSLAKRERERIRIATNPRAEKIRRNDPRRASRVCFGTK